MKDLSLKHGGEMRKISILLLISVIFFHINAITLQLVNQQEIEGKLLSVKGSEVYLAKSDTLYSINRSIIYNYDEIKDSNVEGEPTNYNTFSKIVELDRHNINMQETDQNIKIDGFKIPVRFGDKIELILNSGEAIEGDFYLETDSSIILERYMLEQYSKSKIKKITRINNKIANFSLVSLGASTTTSLIAISNPRFLPIALASIATTLVSVIAIPFSKDDEILWDQDRNNVKTNPMKKQQTVEELIVQTNKYKKTLKQKKEKLSEEIQKMQQQISGLDNEKKSYKKSLDYLLANKQDLLGKVEAALNRIKKNEYGICPITGKRISAARLDKEPWILYSAEGEKILQEQEDQK